MSTTRGATGAAEEIEDLRDETTTVTRDVMRDCMQHIRRTV